MLDEQIRHLSIEMHRYTNILKVESRDQIYLGYAETRTYIMDTK